MLAAAVGIALSPIPIIGVVLILGTPRARVNGPLFALGWLLGITVVIVGVVLLASGASDPDSATETGVTWAKVGLGALFLVMAIRSWRGRPKQGEKSEMPAWMSRVDSFGPGRAFVLGLVISALNPKNLALAAAGATSIAEAGLSATKDVAAVVLFVAVASVTVVGLVGYALVAPRRSSATLISVKEFMSSHQVAIMVVIFAVLGAKLLGDGLGWAS